MPDIRCPECGKNNPDFLDFCQFCQTPLKPESVLRIGEQPTKKNTGELEPILPDWLKDVRQQARESADEQAAQTVSQPRPTQDPLDFLAGLASQAGAGEQDETPDWLAAVNPPAEKAQTPAQPGPPSETDFFAQFRDAESGPAGESHQEETLPWGGETAPAPEKDELSEWFTQAAEKPGEAVEQEPHAEQADRGWGSGFDSPSFSAAEPPPREEEDLSWLRNLEESARQTGELKAPAPDTEWAASFESSAGPSQPAASQEDLSWLDKLGGIEEPSQPSSTQGPAGPDDLSWLSDLGATPVPSQPFEATKTGSPAQEPFASEEEMNLLNRLRAKAEGQQPLETGTAATSPQPAPEDLSWLSQLGALSAQPMEGEPPSPPAREPGWLEGPGAGTEPSAMPPFAENQADLPKAPRRTAPLGRPEQQPEEMPDWLKSATEAPSMPAPGDVSMDWFQTRDQSEPEKAPPAPAAQAAPFSDVFSAPSEPDSLSSQDVDSLFSVEMPDWLSRPEPEAQDSAPPRPVRPSAESEESLAPVDLPSWVQAMRPVEAVISETTPGLEDLPEEKEGPLAGLRGVLPGAPLGSSTRPKAVSLKLQATDEQLTSAALLEQILGSETNPRALVGSSFVASQYALRWAVAALFLLILGAVIGLRMQMMPVSASLPPEGSALSGAVMNIPAGSNVLVVMDYDPSLAGEMEAIGGPVLDQMLSLPQPGLSFVSTSPNGPALAERLMARARNSAPDVQYRNIGFLPGGPAGVLGFLERPGVVIPAAEVEGFSQYAAVLLLTDHAESGRVWVEQLQNRKQIDPLLANQPLLVVASAQAGPLLQPYVASQQVTGMISGLADGARYEASNNRAGNARLYWDAFGIGLAMSIALIVIGSLWALLTGLRSRRTPAEQG